MFDAVGTLITPSPSVAEVYAKVAAKYGLMVDRESLRNRLRATFAQRERTAIIARQANDITTLATDEAAEYAWWREFVSDTLAGVSDPEACFTELWQHFARPQAWKMFDDVAPTLSVLRARGYRLALGSNFDSRLRTVAAGCGLAPLIHEYVISSEVGWRKPAHAFFTSAASRCGAGPQEMLMVGDHPELDGMAALSAGWSAVIIDRSQPPKPTPPRPPTLPPGLTTELGLANDANRLSRIQFLDEIVIWLDQNG